MSQRRAPLFATAAGIAGAQAPPSDEVLLSACAAGDGEALGTLFDRHCVSAFHFLTRYTGAGSPDLDPLVNDTFVEVYRGAGRFHSSASVKTWILGVAANVGRHHVRGEGRRRVLRAALRDFPSARAFDGNRAIEQRDLARRLPSLVEALPHHLRVAFEMCDVDEIPGPDVARALGVPPGTVWRRLHQARKTLRAGLERGGRA